MTEDDSKTSRLFGISSETFEEHTKRIGTLLTKAQEKFDNDYTSYAAVLGSALLAFAGVLAWFEKSPGFTVVAAIIGAVLFVLGLILRHISADKQIGHTHALLDLERERSRFAQRSAVFQHLWLYGPPKNLTPEQLRFFLGDSKNNESDTPSEHLITMKSPGENKE